MRRRLIVLLSVLGLLLPAAASANEPVARGELGLNDEKLLAEAIAANDDTVTVLVAAKGGAARRAASAIGAAGGTIRYRDDALGYLRAEVPTSQVRRLATNASVHALDLDETFEIPEPRPEAALPVIPQPAPGENTPNDNAYMPIRDIGASQFMAANPAWDGRGVTIGIVDTGVSLDHPSLLTTSTGERKIVDWVTGTHPTDDDDPTWIDMSTQVSGETFAHDDVSYTAPAGGSYRIGLLNERDPRLGGETGMDLNRDGNPAGSSGIFAVLWNTGSNTVWVDTDQDASFADEAGMTDYKVNFDVGYFGTDDPATPIAERMPFVVQTDGKAKFVNIGIVSAAHGSHVAGIAAGNALFGGEMSGAAPGAKVVSLRACLFITGCTAHALVEGMIYVAKQANVDVINMSIGGLPALNDGNNARAVIYNRLIDQAKVQMFFSAGNNGPGMNTAGDPGVVTDVVAVGAYITDQTYLAAYGAQLYEAENLHYFSSRGPREDGGFKPQIVAPGAAISTIPMWQPPGCLAHTCPVGYALFNGTSMAAPQAAGGAALLVSAAKQAGAQHQPAQLRQAITSSARFLTDRYEAYEQGNGLMNVGAAWELLRQNIKTVDIESRVEVNTILSPFLAEPGFGVGIYDREGVAPDDAYTRQYTFTRTSGKGTSVTYDVSWVGNDGTFSSAASISLPKNAAVAFDVQVHPETSGVHSAILNLDDPSTPGVDYQTMNTVVAADAFSGPDYTVTKSGELGPGQFDTYFFDVPAGTPAFKVDMTGGGAAAGAGTIRFLRWHPWGLAIDSNGVSNCYNPSIGGCSTGSPTSRTVQNPQPGVWEVTVDARRNSDAASAPYTLTASILGATVSPDPDVIETAEAGTPVAREYEISNLFGTFTGHARGTSLGSAFVDTPSIGHHEQAQFLIPVTAGASSLRVAIGDPSDPAADLDLFVFRCTPTCTQVGSSADGDSEESVTIPNPSAGNYVALVDGFSVPAGTTTYDYVDVFVTPSFGTIDIADADASRPGGASWTVSGSVTANEAPASGRILLGNVQVVTDENVVVGSGDVIVEAVTGP